MGGQKLLILGHTWPEPRATAAGVRMMQLIGFFKEHGWEITFACTSLKSGKSADLKALGIAFQPIKVNDDQFDDFVKDLNPDAILFDRYITEEQFGWRVADVVPHGIRILDTEDLHSLRLAREQAVKAKREFALEDWLGLDHTKRELASIYRSDLSLIISSYEMQLLEKEIGVPASILLHLPFWSDFDIKFPLNRGYAEREGFIFIGNGIHKPNIDAIQYLNDRIWPRIREKLPQAEIIICGAYLPDHIKALHNPDQGFLVKGFVEDAREFMGKARVNLVPLRYGAGLKGKLLLALENGTPSVSTSTGIEGFLDAGIAKEFAFDELQDFANEAVRLYTSETAWKERQGEGYEILDTYFQSEEIKGSLLVVLNNLAEKLEEHRLRNFVGAMLLHHSMRSTKYMSKWITLKNQLKTRHQGT